MLLFSFKVTLIDEFTNPKTSRSSKCYRIIYRSWDRSLSQKEVNDIHKNIESSVTKKFSVEIR